MLTLSRNPISSNTWDVDSLLARPFGVNSRLRAQRRTIKSSSTSKACAFATRAERDPPPLEHGRPQPKKYGNYENAAWIRSMTAKDEVKNRELTETEKEAFLARREQRLGQIQVKKELLKSFKEADMKKAWSLHDKLSHRDQWSYNQMIAVAAKGGFVQKAFSLYQKMKKVPLQPSIGTYHWLLQACANGQGEGEYLARAFYVIEQMKQQNLKLNLHSYNLILQICANAKDVEAAGEVLRKMQADGISADISSLSSLLNCMRGPNLAPIQQVWSEIKSKFTPDARSWNTYISVLRDSGFIQETVQAFKEMLTAPMPSEFDPEAEPSPQVPSAYTLSLVMDACGDAKLFNESRLILYRIMTPEWRSVIKFDDLLFQSMLRTASRLKSNAVFTVVGLMEEKKVPVTPATRSTIIMAYGRTGDLKEATKHFEAARMAGELNLRCFTGLLIACRTSKDADRAWLTFEVLRRSNLRYDDVFVRILTEIFSSSGRPDLMAKLKVVLEEKEAQKSSNLQAKKQNGAQKNESSMSPSPPSSTPLNSEPHIKERLQYHQSKEAERHQEAQTPLIKMRTLKSASILPTANTPSSQQINPLPRTPPVILPSTEPNAGRSMFFAKERLAKLREKQQGDEDL